MVKILTDLDSIFDTRLVMLGVLTNQGELDVGYSPSEYQRRVRNNFGTLSDRLFEMYYSRRDKSVLTYAFPTYLIGLLKDYIVSMVEIDPVGSEEVELTVNTHPYDLTYDEQHVLVLAITKLLPSVSIKCIKVTPEELTPEWVSTNTNLYISYSILEWLEAITPTMQEYDTTLMNTTVMGPFLLKGTLSAEEYSKELVSTTRGYFNTICRFDFVDTRTFCGQPLKITQEKVKRDP